MHITQPVEKIQSFLSGSGEERVVLRLWRGVRPLGIGRDAVGPAGLELERAGQLDVTFVPVIDNDDREDDDDDEDEDDEQTCPRGAGSADGSESRDRRRGSLSRLLSQEPPCLRKGPHHCLQKIALSQKWEMTWEC